MQSLPPGIASPQLPLASPPPPPPCIHSPPLLSLAPSSASASSPPPDGSPLLIIVAPSPSMAPTVAHVIAPPTSFLEALIRSHHSMALPSLAPHGTDTGIPISATCLSAPLDSVPPNSIGPIDMGKAIDVHNAFQCLDIYWDSDNAVHPELHNPQDSSSSRPLSGVT
ncbi:hypothetical protein Salat_0564900 [Sesamum alatum]|uniref:Uncharacterized protein n=1 Tax=Sesamum alatum TaxID=300844 RepID=A0AAE1YPW3_9LAMI|nr:hypothetical protein Salat_0564900 [Sesamum alatum]